MRRIAVLSCVLVFVFFACWSIYAQNRDGGKVQLSLPLGVAVRSGNLFIVDTGNNVVREGTATVAGDGTRCQGPGDPCGDGGPATSAELNFPTSVVLDAAANIYIADSKDQRIRAVNTQAIPINIAGVVIQPGYIATVAGSGIICRSSSDACGDGGPATRAEFHNPSGVALDVAGNIYIADSEDNRIRLVNAMTGIITTIE